jgi:hypothetical protein
VRRVEASRSRRTLGPRFETLAEPACGFEQSALASDEGPPIGAVTVEALGVSEIGLGAKGELWGSRFFKCTIQPH